MKKMVKNADGKYELSELSGMNGFVDCVKAPIKPVLGEVSTVGDSRIQLVTWFLVGAAVGGTVGYKYVQKAKQGYDAMLGNSSMPAYV